MTLKALVVDDEPLAREGIASMLAEDPDIDTVNACPDGESAVSAFFDLSPDLMLLDVEMPGMSGFDVVRAIGPENMPAVIFVTAFDQYAIAAFEAHAIEYLLKPFTDERFAQAIARAKQAIRERRLARLSERLIRLVGDIDTAEGGDRGDPPRQFVRRIGVKTGTRSYFIPVSEIDWVEGADYCAKIHAAGRGHLIRESLASL